MIVTLLKDKKLKEDSITINYRKMNSTINKILEIAEHKHPFIVVQNENRERRLDINDILYIETVDKKYFIYTKNDVYETSNTLHKLENSLFKYGFIRINRSMIANIYRIKEIKAGRNMRILAYLENNEAVTITRHYRKAFFEQTKSVYEAQGEDELDEH